MRSPRKSSRRSTSIRCAKASNGSAPGGSVEPALVSTDALYQEIILEHNRKPKNFREIDGADRTIQGRNPLCGDELTLWMKLDGDAITDVSFKGQGCAISKASASLMTAAVKGKSRADAERLFDQFHRLVKGELGGGGAEDAR